MSIKVVSDWIYAVDSMNALGWDYTVHINYVEVITKNKLDRPVFYEVKDLLNYIYGFNAGLCDKDLYREKSE